MDGLNELNLDQDPDNKMIQLDNNTSDTNINIKNDESTMLGVELLVNQKNNKADLSVTDSIGYSSGEESVKSNKGNITPNEDYDFFDKDEGIQLKGESETSGPEIKKINTPLPQDDPMINSIKGSDSSGFRPIHTMNSQDIKNEKIDLILYDSHIFVTCIYICI